MWTVDVHRHARGYYVGVKKTVALQMGLVGRRGEAYRYAAAGLDRCMPPHCRAPSRASRRLVCFEESVLFD